MMKSYTEFLLENFISFLSEAIVYSYDQYRRPDSDASETKPIMSDKEIAKRKSAYDRYHDRYKNLLAKIRGENPNPNPNLGPTPELHFSPEELARSAATQAVASRPLRRGKVNVDKVNKLIDLRLNQAQAKADAETAKLSQKNIPEVEFINRVAAGEVDVSQLSALKRLELAYKVEDLRKMLAAKKASIAIAAQQAAKQQAGKKKKKPPLLNPKENMGLTSKGGVEFELVRRLLHPSLRRKLGIRTIEDFDKMLGKISNMLRGKDSSEDIMSQRRSKLGEIKPSLPKIKSSLDALVPDPEDEDLLRATTEIEQNFLDFAKETEPVILAKVNELSGTSKLDFQEMQLTRDFTEYLQQKHKGIKVITGTLPLFKDIEFKLPSPLPPDIAEKINKANKAGINAMSTWLRVSSAEQKKQWAAEQITKIPVNQFRILPTQHFSSADYEESMKIAMNAMRTEDSFYHLTVCREGNGPAYIIDGHHRWLAKAIKILQGAKSARSWQKIQFVNATIIETPPGMLEKLPDIVNQWKDSKLKPSFVEGEDKFEVAASTSVEVKIKDGGTERDPTPAEMKMLSYQQIPGQDSGILTRRKQFTKDALQNQQMKSNDPFVFVDRMPNGLEVYYKIPATAYNKITFSGVPVKGSQVISPDLKLFQMGVSDVPRLKSLKKNGKIKLLQILDDIQKASPEDFATIVDKVNNSSADTIAKAIESGNVDSDGFYNALDVDSIKAKTA